MPSDRRALGEWAVLALLAEAPSHPYDLSRQLGASGPLGRVFTLRRPLVYRAVDRLTDDGLAAAERTEPGDSGPERTVYRITAVGQRQLDAWLEAPVAHIRDLRLGFLLKIALLRRSGRPSASLVRAQREALSEALASLAVLPADPDEADLWRHHNAAAVAAFLEDLAGRV